MKSLLVLSYECLKDFKDFEKHDSIKNAELQIIKSYKGKNKYNTFCHFLDKGNKHIAYHMIDRTTNAQTLYLYMSKAAKIGDIKMVKYGIEHDLKITDKFAKRLHYFQCFCSALQNGYLDIANIFINEGVKDFNSALYWAAYGGHQQSVDFLIDRGVDNYIDGLRGSIVGNHIKLVEFFTNKVNKINKEYYLNFTKINSGNLEIIEMIKEI